MEQLAAITAISGNGYYDDGFWQLARLKKEHSSFMRGKVNLAGFYEDKQTLVDVDLISIYSNVNHSYNFRLKVSLLDKERNKVNEFEVDVPKHSEYEWLTIVNVEMVDKQLKVLTQNASRTRVSTQYGNIMETHIYSIDFAKEQIINDVIMGMDKKVDEDSIQQFSLLNDVQHFKNNERVIYQHKTSNLQKQDVKSNVSEGTYTVSSVDYSFGSYNLRTGKEEVIPFPLTNS